MELSWSLYIVAIWWLFIGMRTAFYVAVNEEVTITLKYYAIAMIVPVSPFILFDYI